MIGACREGSVTDVATPPKFAVTCRRCPPCFYGQRFRLPRRPLFRLYSSWPRRADIPQHPRTHNKTYGFCPFHLQDEIFHSALLYPTCFCAPIVMTGDVTRVYLLGESKVDGRLPRRRQGKAISYTHTQRNGCRCR